MKPKDVTTQMKALDKYFPMVAFVNVVAEHSSLVFANWLFNL